MFYPTCIGILFNLYQKESNFLAHGVGLLCGIGDDREVLLFLQLYVALSWAAASTFIFVEAGLYAFSLLKPIHYFLAHSLLLIFTIHHQQAFYHCIDLLIGITIGRMMEWKILFFLDCTLRVFPITQFFLLSDCSDLKTVFKSNQRSNVPRGTFERWRFFFIQFGYI